MKRQVLFVHGGGEGAYEEETCTVLEGEALFTAGEEEIEAGGAPEAG